MKNNISANKSGELPVSHAELANYLSGQSDSAALRQINSVRGDDPAFDVLLTLLDACHKKNAADGAPAVVDLPGHREIEDLISALLTGPTLEQQHRFVHLLRHSRKFYRLLMQKLSNIALRTSTEQSGILEMPGITIRPDDYFIKKFVQPSTPKQERSRLMKIIDNIRAFFRPDPNRSGGGLPRFAAAVPAAIVVLLLAYVFWPTAPHYAGMWDKTSPYNYDKHSLFAADETQAYSGLRSSTNNPESIYQSLYGILLFSLRDYNMQNYQNVIENLEGYGNYPRTLQEWISSREKDPLTETGERSLHTRQLIQEYYFFLGLNYLAYSATDKTHMPDSERTAKQQKAAELLTTAMELGKTYNLDTDGREAYFLARCHLFLDRRDDARTLLLSVPESSAFYPQSQKLLREN